MTRTNMERLHGLPATHLRWLVDNYGDALPKAARKRWLDVLARRLAGETRQEVGARHMVSASFTGTMERNAVARLLEIAERERWRGEA